MTFTKWFVAYNDPSRGTYIASDQYGVPNKIEWKVRNVQTENVTCLIWIDDIKFIGFDIITSSS